MIVAERKAMPEILEMLAPYKRVLALGCGGCVTVCLTGGEKNAELLATQLQLASGQAGTNVTVDFDCVTRQCEKEFFANMKAAPGTYDAVLSLACGAGVSVLSAQRSPTHCCCPVREPDWNRRRRLCRFAPAAMAAFRSSVVISSLYS